MNRLFTLQHLGMQQFFQNVNGVEVIVFLFCRHFSLIPKFSSRFPIGEWFYKHDSRSLGKRLEEKQLDKIVCKAGMINFSMKDNELIS